MTVNDRRPDREPVLEVKSDIYPDGDGARWKLQTRDGSERSAEGRAEDVPGAYHQIREQIEEWYPDDPITGETKIVRIHL